MSNFQPIYRSVCRLAGKGDKRIGIIGGLPRLSSTKERIAAYREAVADCGLPQDEALIRFGNSMENSAQQCLDDLLEQKCDAIARMCRLTNREAEVLALLARGRTVRYICDELSIAQGTAKHHVSNIYRKVGVFDRQGLLDTIEQGGVGKPGWE